MILREQPRCRIIAYVGSLCLLTSGGNSAICPLVTLQAVTELVKMVVVVVVVAAAMRVILVLVVVVKIMMIMIVVPIT